jgi:hypothetical protein
MLQMPLLQTRQILAPVLKTKQTQSVEQIDRFSSKLVPFLLSVTITVGANPILLFTDVIYGFLH